MRSSCANAAVVVSDVHRRFGDGRRFVGRDGRDLQLAAGHRDTADTAEQGKRQRDATRSDVTEAQP
jgi:hypothetical protein